MEWQPSPQQIKAWTEAQAKIRAECQRDIERAAKGEYVDPLRLAHSKNFLKHNAESK